MIISSQVYHYPLNSHYHHLLPQLTPSRVFQLVFFFELFIYLAVLGLSCSMQDLQLQHSNSQLQHMGSSFLTKDRTWAPCIRRSQSQSLDHQGSPPSGLLVSILAPYHLFSHSNHSDLLKIKITLSFYSSAQNHYDGLMSP